MGRKDLIKIEGMLDEIDLDILGALDNNITINIIENGEIIEKKKPNLPDYVENILICKNPRCITSVERGIHHAFRLTDKKKGIYRCIYCEQAFDGVRHQ